MDSIILIGKKNTLVEYMILSGADNRPPMLDKDLYDSWKTRMELYMQNRENGRMKKMGIALCCKIRQWCSQPDKETYSALVVDIAVYFFFLDDQLTSFTPKNYALPDVLFLESWQPAWSASAKAVRSNPMSFGYLRPILMTANTKSRRLDVSVASILARSKIVLDSLADHFDEEPLANFELLDALCLSLFSPPQEEHHRLDSHHDVMSENHHPFKKY
ncbi:hypothetical protein Tco_0232308 [Tanacetum coccineum]